MPYSIGIYFHLQTELLIRDVWKEVADKGLSIYLHESANRPHITLGIFEDSDLTKAESVLALRSQEMKPFTLTFQQIGIFPSPEKTVFWAPVVTKEFLDFHSSFYELFCKFSVQPDFDFYKPGHWIPHCALAMNLQADSDVHQIVSLCQMLPNPHVAKVIEIGLIEIRPVKPLFSYPFLRS